MTAEGLAKRERRYKEALTGIRHLPGGSPAWVAAAIAYRAVELGMTFEKAEADYWRDDLEEREASLGRMFSTHPHRPELNQTAEDTP
jgi:hypothetical protein